VKLATRLIVEEALESVLAGRAASPANAAVTATPTHGRCAGRDFPVGAARTRTGIRLSSATAGRAIPAITTGAAGGAAIATVAADGAGRFDLCPLRVGAGRLARASLGSRLPFATAAARAIKARRASGAVGPVRAIGADLGIRPGIRRPRADEGDE
jgi:hypothetical protein